MNREEFAAQRKSDQENLAATLLPYVTRALADYPNKDWSHDLLAKVAEEYALTFSREGGEGIPTGTFIADVHKTLDKSSASSDPERIALWLATAILNAATMEATKDDPEFTVMEWVTMHDEAVRETHRDTDRQQRPPGEPFDVDGQSMRYPGDASAPPEFWMNCRCVLVPAQPDAASLAASVQEEPMTEPTMTQGPLAWHGVLAPEGEWSGDGRQFKEGSLRFRDLPLPLTWQKSAQPGHDGSVVVGKIERIERVGSEILGEGTFLSTPEADEAVGLVAEFGKFGVSVDADDAAMELNEDTGQRTFTDARIVSASMVPIPAFKEAYVSLGPGPEGFMPSLEVAAALETISTLAWDGSASRFSEAQWKKSCVLHVCTGMEKSCHKLPIRDPGGAINPGGVHAAAARFNQVDAPPEAKSAAKAALRGAYKSIGEEPPDVLKATLEGIALADTNQEMGRGPGWVTNPEDTKRLHDYWTVPGHEGYEKIGWGTPGDWSRCKAQVGEEIGENSPDKLRFLNQICSQWHFDATGYWPGRAPSERTASSVAVSAFGLLASARPALERAGVESIRLGQVMATVAADGSRSQTTAQVLRPGHRLQVFDTDAGPYSAQVVKVETYGDGTVLALVREDVGAGAVPLTVAVPVAGTDPQQAVALDANAVVELNLGAEFCLACSHDPAVVPLTHSSTKSSGSAISKGGMHAHSIGHTAYPTPQSPAPAVSLVASVGAKPPRSWFQNPEFAGPAPFTITDEGQVFGHIAQWKACHIGYPDCTTAPHSATGYAYFLTGYVSTDDGDVPTGPLTIGPGHAGHNATMRGAIAHYDSAATAVCDVTCGEDEHGIWVAGWVRPGATEEQVVAMRASAPSGDWREIRPGQLEMIAALSVNAPGFVTPRVGYSNGHQVSLVAAGQATPGTDDFAWLVDSVAAELKQRIERKARMETLAAPVLAVRRETLAALAQRVGGQ